MNKTIKTAIAIIALIAFSFNAYAVNDNQQGSGGTAAAKVGTAGAQFLRIPFGARGVGMGGAYSAVANDLSSVYWNPAGIADVKSIGAEFNYTQWFATYTHSAAIAAMPISSDFTVAVNMVNFSSGDILITTMDDPEGIIGAKYQVADMSMGITFAGYLTQEFSFGITAKYINNSIYNVSASGLAFDIGTMYNTNIYGIKIAFSIENLGGETSYEGQGLRDMKKYQEEDWTAPLDVSYVAYPYSYPLIFRAGISSDLYNVDDHKIIGAFDFATFSDVPEQFAFGAEYTYSDLISLRGGYQFGQDQFGIAGGIGINYEGDGFAGKFDYSISPTFDLGLVNRFTVGVKF
ncbi:MAG: hypothetical protein A2X64_03505 [Ignavibacteria bacterium GWF2_33_9]|nr:MAG: hypothetical protein A2X64_03505 [Ignavibacteria bacterium GWF2_33_9]